MANFFITHSSYQIMIYIQKKKVISIKESRIKEGRQTHGPDKRIQYELYVHNLPHKLKHTQLWAITCLAQN